MRAGDNHCKTRGDYQLPNKFASVMRVPTVRRAGDDDIIEYSTSNDGLGRLG